MIKVIPPGAYDFGEPPVSLIKVSSRGLLGSDLDAFIKRSSHQFADALRGLEKKADETLVHLIAVSADEATGANRNGDSFTIPVCRRYHDTFPKHARWYRDHSNRDPAKSYGLVKLSAYNDRMRRIELIVGLNATKEAATRNGGLVADRELEKLANGKDIAVSMSCKVSHDVCSSCGNKARSRDEYCTADMCKRGGLRSNMGKVCADGHQLRAFNPDPKFFDISDVGVPAEPTAYVLGLAKSAGVLFKSGAQLAEEAGLTCPFSLLADDLQPWEAAHVKAAHLLAAASPPVQLRQAFHPSLRQTVPNLLGLHKLASDRHRAFAALADEQVLLPLNAFATLIGMSEALTERAAVRLPGSAVKLAATSDLADRLANNPFQARRTSGLPMRKWASGLRPAYGLRPQDVNDRRLLAAVRQLGDVTLHEKQASFAADPDAEHLSAFYTLYKVAFLQRWIEEPAEVTRLAGLLALNELLA